MKQRVYVIAAFLFLLAMLLGVRPARAHDFPDEVTIHTFVKPEGERLHVLLRVPLVLLLNMDLPKRGPGYLDLAQIDPALEASAATLAEEVAFYEDGVALTPLRFESRVSIPADQSFADYESALAHIEGPPLPESTNLFWNQGYFDVHIEYPIESAHSDFSLQTFMGPEIQKRLHLIIRFHSPEGPVRAYDVVANHGRIVLDPHWYQAAWTFTRTGFFHILDGIDHLLFLVCLVIPFRDKRLRQLISVVTSFTIAHSITLIAAAYNLGPSGDWFPLLVETLIAVSILYMALENILVANLERRWLITGAFGLVHGFGFSYGLQESFQLAGDHLLLSLLSFNVGVEVGQILVLIVAIVVLRTIMQQLPDQRLAAIVLSALVAHTAWHWMLDRGQRLWAVEWPELTASSLQTLAAVALIVLLGPGVARILSRQLAARHRREELGAVEEEPA